MLSLHTDLDTFATYIDQNLDYVQGLKIILLNSSTQSLGDNQHLEGNVFCESESPDDKPILCLEGHLPKNEQVVTPQVTPPRRSQKSTAGCHFNLHREPRSAIQNRVSGVQLSAQVSNKNQSISDLTARVFQEAGKLLSIPSSEFMDDSFRIGNSRCIECC